MQERQRQLTFSDSVLTKHEQWLFGVLQPTLLRDLDLSLAANDVAWGFENVRFHASRDTGAKM
jgi:hypothetical protein